MHTIAVIDDKNIAYKQIINALDGLGLSNHYEVKWHKSFKEYEQTNHSYATAVFLDYHLDIDLTHGTKIVSQLKAQYLVGYSSTQKGSDRIRQKGIASGLFKDVFSLVKEKSETPTSQLIKVLNMIASDKK
jgi:hypothetical protein